MIHLALIDEELARAIVSDQASRGSTRDLAVVWSGGDLDALLTASIDPAPDVIVLDRARLPADPTAALAELKKRQPARTIITTYDFASAAQIESLRRAGSDVVLQGPLSVRSLRTFLLSLLIERRLQRQANTPPPGPSVEDAPVLKPRYSRAALLQLRDMKSAIRCECPNHVAELVDRLTAFEGYSKACENKDDDDAAMHRLLWFASARARRIMEDALDRLLQHEGIVVEGDDVRRLAPGSAGT